MPEVFEIATEDGGVFCKCSNVSGTPILIGKEGNLSLQKLMDQAYNPQIAKQMRGKKLRTRHPNKTDKMKA